MPIIAEPCRGSTFFHSPLVIIIVRDASVLFSNLQPKMSSGAANNLFRYFLALRGDLRLIQVEKLRHRCPWYAEFLFFLFGSILIIITIKLVCVRKMITQLREPRQRTHTLTTNESGPGPKTNPRSLFLCYLYQ